MNARMIKLKFKSPYHLSPSGASLEKTGTSISSDMLVSALAVCHTKLYGTFSEDFFSPKLRVSSLFPYYKETLFFPAPLFDYIDKSLPRTEYKKMAKLKYLEYSLWSRVIQGQRLTRDALYPLGMFGVSSEKKDHIPPFLFEEEIQRLGADPFYFSQVRLADDAGLFFLFDADPSIEPQLKACLRLLADEGIGADRTVGKGLFEFSPESQINLPGVDSSHTAHILSLSFFIPSEEDFQNIDFADSFYHLEHKRGWYITHKVMNLKKKGIFGFSEGSVFSIRDTRGAHGAQYTLTGKKVTLLSKEEMASQTKSPFEILRHGFLYGIPVTIPTPEVMDGQ